MSPCDRRPERRASCSRDEIRSPRRWSGSRRCEVEIESRDEAGTRGWLEALRGPTSARRACGARPLVERVEQPIHLQVGQRELIAEPAREQRPAVAHRGQPADDLDAGRAERVEVERRALRRADQLRRRQPPGARQVVDLVVALVPDTRGVHPPQHVAAAIGPRQPHVLADRRASPAGRSGGFHRPAARRWRTRRRPARRLRGSWSGLR